MGRHENEVLTDNTQIEYCKQCRMCCNWGHTGAFGNAPEKASCDMFPYPGHKPQSVINNTGRCPYFIKR